MSNASSTDAGAAPRVEALQGDLCEECGEPWPEHGDGCSMHPDNIGGAPDAM